MRIEISKRVLRHAGCSVDFEAVHAAIAVLDDVDPAVVKVDASSAFPCRRYDGPRQYVGAFEAPVRPKVLVQGSSRRPLQVGGHDLSAQQADAIFAVAANQLLEQVVSAPLAPGGVEGDHGLAAAAGAVPLLGDHALRTEEIQIIRAN